MVVTDPTSDAYPAPTPTGRRARATADRRPRLAAPTLEPLLPLLVTAAVLAGLVLAVAVTPIGSGDYGQWLMTSRPYLGQDVPGYRDLGDVPPIVPILLAGIRIAIPDAMVALHVLAALLVVGMGIALYLLGTFALESRWAGALAVVIGLLITDRFTDLFAFGGLLQVAALTFLCLAVAAFTRAGHAPVEEPRWVWLGVLALGLTAVTHVGTGLIAVPVGMSVAGMVALAALSRSGWDPAPLVERLRLPALALAIVALYWLLVLVPASGEYVTNPASLAYRGPERLWADLFGRWPTTVVLVVGATTLLLGMLRALVQRRLDGYLVVGTWAALAWSVLVYSLVSGSATDFPRFATPLIAPLVIGAAGGVLWVLRTFAASLSEIGWRGSPGLIIGVAVVAAVLVATPLTIQRHTRQATFYELRDADALTGAAAWIEDELGPGQAVLADVREGKWIEGLTGRPALFSQAVRYAFRPAEWQRSTEADALLRSTLTLTSGHVAAQFTDQTGSDDPVPTGLLVRANHGGEYADLLRILPAATLISGPDRSVTAAALAPMRATRVTSERQASVRTVWGVAGDPGFSYTQTVTVFTDGTTLRITQAAPGHRLATELTPAFGMAITSLEIEGREAVACFTELGGSEPCVRIRATDDEVRLTSTPDGALLVASGGAGWIELLVTALTSGDATVDLGILDPADLVEAHDIGAVLLHEPDPAYQTRFGRFQALGFEEGRAFGPYRVLLRQASGSP